MLTVTPLIQNWLREIEVETGIVWVNPQVLIVNWMVTCKFLGNEMKVQRMQPGKSAASDEALRVGNDVVRWEIFPFEENRFSPNETFTNGNEIFRSLNVYDHAHQPGINAKLMTHMEVHSNRQQQRPMLLQTNCVEVCSLYRDSNIQPAFARMIFSPSLHLTHFAVVFVFGVGLVTIFCWGDDSTTSCKLWRWKCNWI